MSASLAAPPGPDGGIEFKQLFRKVMGRFATGVTVVTTITDDCVYGMTANAFMAGSLEPPLCVVSINRTAKLHARFPIGARFGVSFLSEWQQHLSSHFAGKRFDTALPEFTLRDGTPILSRAVGAVTAEVVATADCGDHTLFIGRITHLESALGRPLLFYGGRYARIDFANPIEEAEPPEFW
jgi:flavin reductase (DIM6/NTAB) family NADH-FMN oxidoreductase RutF